MYRPYASAASLPEKTDRMGLLSVWKERKEVSPHRPKRARTGWLFVALAVVLIAIWLLSGVQ